MLQIPLPFLPSPPAATTTTPVVDCCLCCHPPCASPPNTSFCIAEGKLPLPTKDSQNHSPPHLHHGPLVGLLDGDKYNSVTLFVLLPVLIPDLEFGWVVMFFYCGRAHAISLEAHYLCLAPQKGNTWVHLLLPVLFSKVVPGNDMSTALAIAVLLWSSFLKDLVWIVCCHDSKRPSLATCIWYLPFLITQLMWNVTLA